jgi:nucleotide-binding universal stress UspA family protein
MVARRNSSPLSLRRILLAIDGSENAAKAASTAIALAKMFGAQLVVCHVIQMPTSSFGKIDAQSIYFDAARKNARTLLRNTVKRAETKAIEASELLIEGQDSVVEAIVSNAANLNADLIVLGTRGEGSFRKLLLGSVSSGVLNHARCAILIVR